MSEFSVSIMHLNFGRVAAPQQNLLVTAEPSGPYATAVFPRTKRFAPEMNEVPKTYDPLKAIRYIHDEATNDVVPNPDFEWVEEAYAYGRIPPSLKGPKQGNTPNF